MKKTFYLIIALVILFLAFFYFSQKKIYSPTEDKTLLNLVNPLVNSCRKMTDASLKSSETYRLVSFKDSVFIAEVYEKENLINEISFPQNFIDNQTIAVECPPLKAEKNFCYWINGSSNVIYRYLGQKNLKEYFLSFNLSSGKWMQPPVNFKNAEIKTQVVPCPNNFTAENTNLKNFLEKKLQQENPGWKISIKKEYIFNDELAQEQFTTEIKNDIIGLTATSLYFYFDESFEPLKLKDDTLVTAHFKKKREVYSKKEQEISKENAQLFLKEQNLKDLVLPEEIYFIKK